MGVTASLVAQSRMRKSIIVQNLHATNKLYVGVSAAVSASDGIQLSTGDALEFSDYLGPVYAIADGASTPVHYLEVGGN